MEDANLFPKIFPIVEDEFYLKTKTTAIRPYLTYYAPEYLTCSFSNYEEIYVYSFAMIAYTIITGNKPFSKMDNMSFFNDVTNGIRPKFDPSISRSCICDLIKKCWSEAESRPKLNEILDELKNNPDFITDSIDKDEYFNYIKYVDSNAAEPLLIDNEDDEEEVEGLNDDKPLFISDVKTLNLCKYEKREQIGSGGFGEVFKIVDKHTGHFFCSQSIAIIYQ